MEWKSAWKRTIDSPSKPTIIPLTTNQGKPTMSLATKNLITAAAAIVKMDADARETL
jgi:hypothetical protein